MTPVTHQVQNWCNLNSNYAIQVDKLSNSISQFIFLFCQFINSVIKILVTPATHWVCNWCNLFSTISLIRIW